MITIISDNNQITLPAEIVRTLELAPGMQLDWTIGPDGTLIASPQPTRTQRVNALMGAGRKYLRPGSDPVHELIQERLQDEEPYGVES